MPYGFYLKQKIGGDSVFRLQNERDELAERYEKLEAFLSVLNTRLGIANNK